MLSFEYWERAVRTRDEILNLWFTDETKVQNLIDSAVQNLPNVALKNEFLNYLSSLFLTLIVDGDSLVLNGQISAVSIGNCQIARTYIKSLL